METVYIITTLFYTLSTMGYVFFLVFQKKKQYLTACSLLIAGFFLHSFIIGWDFAKSGFIPVSNLQETLMIASWAIAGVFLFFQYKFQLRILGVFAAPLITLIVMVSSLVPEAAAQAENTFNNFWVIFHVIAIFLGEASFALACGAGILYLIQENAIKNKKPGFFLKRLPSLDLLDSAGYAFIVVGFTLLTTGLIFGFIYAKIIWSKFWSWDPKEVWSGITWLIYAALLHERLTVGWRGRRAAIMSIIGFAFLLFTFLGVNLLMEGHHGVFTKW